MKLYPINLKAICKSPIVIICLLYLTSCESFLAIDSPNDQLIGKVVYEDPVTVTAALTNIYAHLRDDGITNGQLYGMTTLLGLYSDELDLYSNTLPQVEAFYTHNLVANNTNVERFWTSSYNLIFAVNSIIEGVTNSTTIAQEVKEQFLGEAYFIRAFLHFHLVNLYGDIPYIATTDYTKNSKVSRTPISEVYSALIEDLMLSKSLLGSNYATNDKVRPNKWAAVALLARVYLYAENWEKALQESDAIIKEGGYILESNVNNVFLKDSKETVWQFSPAASSYNTYEGYTFIFNSGPPRSLALTNTLVQVFAPEDQRQTNWIKGVTDGTSTWYHPNKYKQRAPTARSLEYTIVFRLGEQYLIRSEAKVRLGDLEGARLDVNRIRNRAGIVNLLTSSVDGLLEEILLERQRELFTEFGHRWFDLKRSGNGDTTLSPIKIGWNSTDLVLPIPESELVLNPNLNPQNNGY